MENRYPRSSISATTQKYRFIVSCISQRFKARIIYRLPGELDFKHSKNYMLLKKYHGLLLKNGKDLKIYTQPSYNKLLGRMMTTSDNFDWMYKIDPALEKLRNLNGEYIVFNNRYTGDLKGARKALPQVIYRYKTSEFKMYRNIGDMIESNFDAIINSFIMLEKQNGDKVRLSNGPIESLNRITKDMKRIARGFSNFEYVRNRFLFVTRKNAAILGVPKRLEDTYLHILFEEQKDEYFSDEDIGALNFRVGVGEL